MSRLQTQKDDVEDQYTILEQIDLVENPGPDEQEPVRVEPKQLSFRAELAILGYSLWDLTTEVVARAVDDHYLTEPQKEIIFQKMQDQTEKSIRKVLKKESGRSNL